MAAVGEAIILVDDDANDPKAFTLLLSTALALSAALQNKRCKEHRAANYSKLQLTF